MEPLSSAMVAASTVTVWVMDRLPRSKTATLAGAGLPSGSVPPHSKPQFKTYAVVPLTMALTGRLKRESFTMVQTLVGFELGGLMLGLV